MSKPPLDVQTIIDERFSPCQRLLLALCFLVVAVDGFDTAAVGYIAPALVQEWGVPRAALGPVLSAALFGLALGALSAGPLADRYGRKSVLLASVLFFGAGSLASAFAATLEQLTLLRLLTGLGLGAAMPNAVTLMSEFAPARYRAVLVNAMFCGFPLGASAGWVLASWLIPHYGWRSVLLLGGLAPLALAVPLWRYLPESVRHMAAHGAPPARIRRVLERIAGRDLGQNPQAPRDLLVGLFDLAEIAAETILVELLVGFDVPEPAIIRADLVGEDESHLIVLVIEPAEFELEVD
jgi:AAHS family 4-hydroxybenzoate transporter-like MFS transporter